MKKVTATWYILLLTLAVQAQELPDTRMVGIVAFATSTYEDSLAAKNVYATISRLMVQTGRFTVLEIDKWKQTQNEIDRQKGAGFLESDIIASGKSLGARILLIGQVKNAEIYQDAGVYTARVDYELRFIDVETGKSIAASSFTGDSENKLKAGIKVGKGIAKLLPPSMLKGNLKTLYQAGSTYSAMPEPDRKAINSKLVDAVEETAFHVNAWIRSTFNFSLLFLKTLDDDKKKGAQYILIEGGEDIGMKEGDKMKMVLVTEAETAKGKIRDEEPIAELQVEEVRAQTSKCKVISGGKRITEEAQNKNLRIIFN